MDSELPSPIEDVAVPEDFSPSTWARMEACALSVWADTEGVLPVSVRALVGRVLHVAREVVLERGLVGIENADGVRAVIAEAKASEESRLATSGESPSVSLDLAYGRRRWLQRVAWLEDWARRSAAVTPSRTRVRHRSPNGNDSADRFALGVEPSWVLRSLRLAGRPDEAVLDGAGIVTVVDFKTGFVSPTRAHHIETQLQLYLLMAEILSGRAARGVVEGSVDFKVPWTPAIREATLARVEMMISKFPGGSGVRAADVASPGPHCGHCRLRPRCASYLSQASSWWPNSGEHPRPMPLDAWGRLVDVDIEPIGFRVRLEDDLGRLILVRGLDPRTKIDRHPIGTKIFIFDLQSTEDSRAHGRRIHPRAFHQRSPGARWATAWTTSVFHRARP